MKKVSMILALVLVLSMLFTACGASQQAATSDASTAAAVEQTAADAAEASAPAASAEPYTIKYAFIVMTQVPKDLAVVQEEMSKKTMEKINAKVEFMTLSLANYQQQLNLMLSSGEKLDLITELGTYLSGDVAKNRLIELDDLISQYGPEVTKNLGTYLKAGQFNNKIYAMPAIRNMGNAYGLVVRKDLADKYGIDVSAIKTYDDCEAFFQTIKKNEPGVYPVMAQTGSSSVYEMGFNHFDPLGDGFGVLMDLGTTKVVNKYEDAQYKESLNIIRKWYKAGYIPKDHATMTDSATGLVKSGKVASFFSNIKPGYENQAGNQAGTQMVMTQLVQPFAVSQAIAMFSMALPINCKDPVSTMKFVNLMYSDPEIINLIDWGIDGKHYVTTDDGTINHPEGIDSKTTGWGLNMGFQFGNQLLSHVWKGDSPDLYKNLKAFNDSATLSGAFGFNFDGSAMKTEYAALSNVQTQYRLALEDGALDPESTLNKLNKALYDAGLEKYIAEKQKQLDAWLATQK